MSSEPVKISTLALLCSLWLVAPLTAQIPYSDLHRPLVRKWTSRHGLPQDWIKAIAQTPDGALWIGTGTGLARFDGVSFETFDRVRYPELPSVDILDLRVDGDGTLWIATRNGLAMSRRTGVFERVATDLPFTHPLFVNTDESLWILDREAGAFRLDNERWRQIEVVNHQGGAPPRGLGCAAIRGKDLWFFNPLIAVPSDVAALPWLDTQSCSVDSRGVLYTWFDGSGRLESLRRFSRSTQGGILTSLPEIPASSLIAGFKSTRDGETWVGMNDGLYRLQDSRFQRITLTGNPISALFEDAEGSLWAGTNGDGLLQVVRNTRFSMLTTRQGLPHEETWAALDIPEGHLYVATASGVTRYVDGRPETLPMEGRSADYTRIFSLAVDDEGTVWTGGQELSRAQGDRLVSEPLISPIRGKESQVRSRILPRGGEILAGGRYGLYSTRHPSLEPIQFGNLEDFHLRDLLIDRRGRLWAASQGYGLFRNDGSGFRQVLSDPAKIKSLLEDEDGSLWITSREQGLVFYDGEAFHRVTSQQGLFDNTIHDIVDDGLGWFWLTSDRGIARIQKEDLRAAAVGSRDSLQTQQVFGLADGLLSLECNSGFPGARRLQDGRLVFATMKGLAVIDPARMRTNTYPPPVEIRAVTTQGGEVPLPEPGKPLRLGPDQRHLAVAFTAMTFVAPDDTIFSYKLEGYDADWIEAGTRRQALYTGIPPGSYTLRVRAKNHDGFESAEDAVLDIELKPYFHETTAFTLATAAAAVAVLWLVFRWWASRRHERRLEIEVAERTRSLAEEKRKTEAQAAELAELNLLKDRFFANLSHELRTPLTLLVGPLEELAADPDNSRRTQDARMARNARVLERRVDELLDLARLEAGHLHLDCIDVDIYDFVRRRCAAFEPAARKKDIQLEIAAAPRDPRRPRPRVWIDRHRMEKVLWNLLGNAVKFTPRGGSIQVAVEPQEDTVRIVVADTGPGIPETDLPHIFDRFYRSPAGRSQPGTGIGLALTRELVERHGGRIAGSRRHEGGACFTIELRLGNVHLAAEDLSTGSYEASDDGSGFDLAASEPVGAGKPGATVLVVEDDAELRSWLIEILSPHYLTLKAENGEQGLSIARKLVPDLILSDISMPKMDGFELARALRSDAATDHVPIVFLSARGSTETRIGGFEDGIDAYLTKPFNPRELLSRIEALLATRKRLQRRLGGTFTLEGRSVDVESADEVFLRRVLESVEARLQDPGFGALELAEAVHLSRRQLHRKLSALTGESPASLIRRLRLEKARSLLEQGAGNVGEVAASVGFGKAASFSEAFTKTFGAPPSSFLPS